MVSENCEIVMYTDDSGQIRGAVVGMGRLQPPQILNRNGFWGGCSRQVFNRNGYLGRLQKVYKSRHFFDKTCFILDTWSVSG